MKKKYFILAFIFLFLLIGQNSSAQDFGAPDCIDCDIPEDPTPPVDPVGDDLDPSDLEPHENPLPEAPGIPDDPWGDSGDDPWGDGGEDPGDNPWGDGGGDPWGDLGGNPWGAPDNGSGDGDNGDGDNGDGDCWWCGGNTDGGNTGGGSTGGGSTGGGSTGGGSSTTKPPSPAASTCRGCPTLLVSAEGDDNGDEYIENDNYSNFQPPKQTLPGLMTFYNAYPKNSAKNQGMVADEVYNLIGGSILNSHINNPAQYSNACALRVSRALNYTGKIIPVYHNDQNEQKTQKGVDNLNYILDAVSLLDYMKKTFPTTSYKHFVGKTPAEIKQQLNGKYGIYIMIPKNRASFGASGHADFWSNTGCYTNEYLNSAKEVFFWELK